MTNLDIEDSATQSYVTPGGLLNVRLLIEKEFLEEAFSIDWAKECHDHRAEEDWPNAVERCANAHLHDYGAEILLTGVVFDLLNYRPEICMLILIKDENWWDHHYPHETYGRNLDREKNVLKWKLSYEWLTEHKKLPYDWLTEHKKDIFLEGDRNVLEAMPLNKSVMSGVAAFYLGINKARKILRS